MNIIEAIQKRKSVRKFKNKPVSKELLHNILDVSVRSPSAMNSQPWEFLVITGNIIEEIKKRNCELLTNSIIPESEHVVAEWGKESVWRERQVDLAKSLFKLMDIKREDKEKRIDWMKRGFRFFDAPAVIIIICDKALGEKGPVMDIGSVTQTICLAAMEFGLSTCIEDQGVMYPDVLREVANIPDTKKIMIAIAIGEEDPDFPANAIVTKRVPANEITTWLGFE